jgi:rifampicin phosphotransferase
MYVFGEGLFRPCDAIVAREYGIPAVVGVPQAIERIPTGKSITVDGTAGTIVIEPGTEEEA